MVNFKDLLITSVLASIFVIAMIAFGVNLAADNDASISITNNSAILDIYSTLNESIIADSSTAKAQWNATQGSDITMESDIGLVSLLKIAANFPRIAWTSFNTIMKLLASTLGIPPVFLYSIITILLIVIVVSAYSLIKAGR